MDSAPTESHNLAVTIVGADSISARERLPCVKGAVSEASLGIVTL